MLHLQNVSVSYDQPVLYCVDLEVGQGEIVCILGPSGGGKSTLLRAVAGLVDYTGRIEVAGRPLEGVPTHRRAIGMMFQDDLLFPHLNVAENVGLRSDGPPMPVGSTRRWIWSAWPASRTGRWTRSVVARHNVSPWPGRWPQRRRWCCSTSRSARWTRC